MQAPRIGVVTQDFAGAPEAAGAEALRIAALAAERAGASVRALALPEIVAEAWRIHPTVQEFEAHQALAWEYRENYDAMPPLLRARLDESKGTAACRLRRGAQDREPGAARHWPRSSTTSTCLLTFSAPGAAPEGTGLDRRSPFQPAVDADGRALRQRSRASSPKADCRSACR